MKARLAFLVVCCAGSIAHADPRDPILAGWDASRKRLKSVRYTLSGTRDEKPGAFGGKSSTPPPAEPRPKYSGVMLLDLARRLHRLEDTTPTLSTVDRSKYTTRYRVWAYDGEIDRSVHPRARNEHEADSIDMHVSRGDMRSVDFPAGYIPLFIAHGYVPSSRDRVGPGHWPAPSDREEFTHHGSGVIAGRTHTILRGEPWKGFVDEYWSDPGRDGATGRFVIWSDKSPYMRFDMDYQEVGGVWVLKRWTHTVTWEGRVAQVHRYEVDRVDLNPTVGEADFVLPVEPGFIVKEHVYPAKGSGLNPDYPANRTIRAKPGGGSEVLESTGFQTHEGIPVPLEVPWWRRWWVWVLVVIGIAGVLGVVTRRRVHLRAADGPASDSRSG